jgi:hypothetical protein
VRIHDLRFRHLLLATLVGVALVAGACSNDSEESDSSDKTAEADTSKDSDQPDEADDSGSDEGPSADFSATVAEAMTAIEASSDPCELYTAVGALASVGNPETQEQTKQATDFYVAMLNKMAETSSDPAVADTLRSGASEFEEYAKSVDYDPEKMDLNGSGPDFESAAALDEAMNAYGQTEFVDCEIPGAPGPEVTTGE